MKKLLLKSLAVALLLSFFFPQITLSAPVKITILHTNDIHGQIEPFKEGRGSEVAVGGLARMSTLIKEIRRQEPHLLLLDAGDTMQGTTISYLFEGRSVIDLMNRLKYDAWAVGNHDFDFGQTLLLKRIFQAQFPALAANLIDTLSGEQVDFAKAFIVKELGGVKIAILGLTNPLTPTYMIPENTKGIKFENPIETTKQHLPLLREQANIVIILSHMGLDTDRELAQHVHGIDLIIGGHSHTSLQEPEWVEGVPIVQAGSRAEYLGRIDLVVDGKKIQSIKGRLIRLTPEIQDDPEIVRVISDYRAKLERIVSKEVGVAEIDMPGGEELFRKEAILGNFITDVIREYTGAEIAIHSASGMRAGLKKGPITLQKVYDIVPFDDETMKVKLKGKVIKEILEHCISKFPDDPYWFLHLSGMRVVYDLEKPVGERVVKAFVGNAPLDPNREYTIGTESYLVAGGHRMALFKEGEVIARYGINIREVVQEYIEKKGKIAGQLDGRVTFVGNK
ncbi:MAG: bifunctional metallophosphatase/5'-nucleotidase [Candidatus Tectomicrobia bacterium]|nr:bifunctional metallophosphatase/5'-nucleotidase [Candidatus Tectomicrobia bacterium]